MTKDRYERLVLVGLGVIASQLGILVTMQADEDVSEGFLSRNADGVIAYANKVAAAVASSLSGKDE